MAPEIDIADDLPEDDDDARAEIVRLETRVDDLADAIARCRKIIFAARIAVAAGAIWTLAVIVGAVEFDAMAMLAAIAAILGGIAVFGSNTTTLKQMSAALKDAEARRAYLIGMLRLRVVSDAKGGEE